MNQNQHKRVFITGLGAITASGATVADQFTSVLAGNVQLGEIREWDISSWSHRLGGEIQSFKPAELLPDKKLMKVISRQDVMGIYAAIQAVEDSGFLPYRATLTDPLFFNEKTAVYVGSPGNKYMQQYDFLPLVAKAKGNMDLFAKHLFETIHPMWLLRILPNNVLAYTGITYGFKGINQNITNHGVSGAQAIIEAYYAIQHGLADRAVVVAYDIATEPQALFYYDKLGVISARHLKPFDKEHDGTVLAEGAAALILESEDSVRLRAGIPYAELIGGASTSEAAGLFSIEEDGASLAALMKTQLEQGSLSPLDIGCVVAHGNGNPKSDVSEAKAILSVFKDHSVPVTAFKWAMGHTVAASGVVDAVLTTCALKERCIPGIATLHTLATSCGTLNADSMTRAWAPNAPYALVINRGYAGMNACLVLKAYDESY